VQVAKWLPGILLTHIPVHPSELRRGVLNVHGHLHARSVGDARYVCVSLEQTNFSPVPLELARRALGHSSLTIPDLFDGGSPYLDQR
jgi:calcineurin-like phosphoesterase family protein